VVEHSLLSAIVIGAHCARQIPVYLIVKTNCNKKVLSGTAIVVVDPVRQDIASFRLSIGQAADQALIQVCAAGRT
jgi:hypothetical protein